MKYLILIVFVLLISCEEKEKTVFDYMTPIQERYWSKAIMFDSRSYDCKNNDICKEDLQHDFEKWCTPFWKDSLPKVVNWVGKLDVVSTKDSMAFFLLRGYNGEIFEGIISNKDSILRSQLSVIPEKSYIVFSAKRIGGNPDYINDNSELEKPSLKIILDSIKQIDYKKKPL